MSAGALIGQIAQMARTLAPLIVGGPAVNAAVEAGEAMVKLIDQAGRVFANEDQTDLASARAELVERVNAHSDRTIGRLEGR